MKKDNLYRDTLKSNTLFGGVKLFQIIVVLIRSKLVAIILGPTGVGIQSLFISTIDSLQQFTTLGIFQSAVRDISLTINKEDGDSEIKLLSVFKTLVIIVGLFGFIVTFLLSGYLSFLVFGNYDYTSSFIILSFALFFLAVSNGFVTILQGRRQLIELAKGSLVGAIISLLIVIPIYFYGGIKSISVGILFSYIVTCFTYYFFISKYKFFFKSQWPKFDKIKYYGFPIIKLGVILMLSNGLMALFTLLLNSYINQRGGSSDVGFYNAISTATYGNIIIFTSILASDYYPKLTQNIENVDEFNKLVNQQIELLIIFISPIICFLITFSKQVVIILYSNEFITIVPLIRIVSISLLFKIIWHSFSFVILAHGDKKSYFYYDALIGNGLFFLFNVLGYYLSGLFGLSLSFVFGSLFMMVLLYCVVFLKYKVRIERNIFILLIGFVLICLLSLFVSISCSDSLLRVFFEVLLLIIILSTSIYTLNKRIGFIDNINFFKTKR